MFRRVRYPVRAAGLRYLGPATPATPHKVRVGARRGR